MTAFTVTMPLPPSAEVQHQDAPGRGRVYTAEYSAWREQAGWRIAAAWRAAGRPGFAPPLALMIHLGLPNRGRDAGSCLKPIEDLLAAYIPGMPDDRFNDLLAIRRDGDVDVGTARVTVTSLSGGPPG